MVWVDCVVGMVYRYVGMHGVVGRSCREPKGDVRTSEEGRDLSWLAARLVTCGALAIRHLDVRKKCHVKSCLTVSDG